MKLTSLPQRQQDAYHKGLPYYFTGRKCKFGHLAPRRTLGNHCTACLGLEIGDLAHQPIVTRKFAQAQGLKTYFTGKPCKRGHLAERRTDSCACCECLRENNEPLPEGFTMLRLRVRNKHVELIKQIVEDMNK